MSYEIRLGFSGFFVFRVSAGFAMGLGGCNGGCLQ